MKTISFIYKRIEIKKILIHLSVYEERKNQRTPPQINKENTKPAVEIVPYDDGWPEYEEAVLDFLKTQRPRLYTYAQIEGELAEYGMIMAGICLESLRKRKNQWKIRKKKIGCLGLVKLEEDLWES